MKEREERITKGIKTKKKRGTNEGEKNEKEENERIKERKRKKSQLKQAKEGEKKYEIASGRGQLIKKNKQTYKYINKHINKK